MEIDEALLNDLDPNGPPILHLYEWVGDAATFGYFTDPQNHLLETDSIDLAKRPTGGGIVFHIWDLAFSVLIPANHPGYSKDTMDNYKLINESVIIAVKEFSNDNCQLLPAEPADFEAGAEHFCYGKPTKYDVMFQGKKVAGSAQRCKKNGFLHQGSISLAMPDETFLKRLLPLPIVESILTNTKVLVNRTELAEGRREMIKHLQKSLFAI